MTKGMRIGVADIAIILLMLMLSGVAVFHRPALAPEQVPTATSTAPAASSTPTDSGSSSGPGTASGGTAGAHCGGFILNAPTCAAGFHCVLDVSKPDTGGSCVADTTGSGSGASGVKGSVLLGPTCPVERMPPDPSCADKPYATTITARSGNGAVVATTHSGSDGTFTLSLPVGIYTLSAAGGQTLPRCADVSVTVPQNAYATTSISCDTGIR